MRSVFVAPLLLSIVLASCYRLPAENRLVENFASHRKVFDNLLKMSSEDWRYRRVSGGQTPPTGMTQERYRSYRALFRELGIEDGLIYDLNPTCPGIYILAGVMVPIGGKSRSVGYFHSLTAPAALVNSLGISSFPFETRSGRGHETVYRKLEDGWYLFYDNSA